MQVMGEAGEHQIENVRHRARHGLRRERVDRPPRPPEREAVSADEPLRLPEQVTLRYRFAAGSFASHLLHDAEGGGAPARAPLPERPRAPAAAPRLRALQRRDRGLGRGRPARDARRLHRRPRPLHRPDDRRRAAGALRLRADPLRRLRHERLPPDRRDGRRAAPDRAPGRAGLARRVRAHRAHSPTSSTSGRSTRRTRDRPAARSSTRRSTCRSPTRSAPRSARSSAASPRGSSSPRRAAASATCRRARSRRTGGGSTGRRRSPARGRVVASTTAHHRPDGPVFGLVLVDGCAVPMLHLLESELEPGTAVEAVFEPERRAGDPRDPLLPAARSERRGRRHLRARTRGAPGRRDRGRARDADRPLRGPRRAAHPRAAARRCSSAAPSPRAATLAECLHHEIARPHARLRPPPRHDGHGRAPGDDAPVPPAGPGRPGRLGEHEPASRRATASIRFPGEPRARRRRQPDAADRPLPHRPRAEGAARAGRLPHRGPAAASSAAATAPRARRCSSPTAR